MSMTPERFFAQVEAALHENARRMDSDRRADGGGPARGFYYNHFMVHAVLEMFWAAVRQGYKPPHREGYGAAAVEGEYPQRGGFVRMLVDGWDPADPHGAQLLNLDSVFCAMAFTGRPMVLQPGHIQREAWRRTVVHEARARHRAAKAAYDVEQAALEDAYVMQRVAAGQAPRLMPHQPSLRGVGMHWEFALANEKHAMAAVCGYALGEPLTEVARLLGEGVRSTLARYGDAGHSSPYDHLEVVSTAVALGMDTEALALANMPKTIWCVPSAESRITAIIATMHHLLGVTDRGWPGDLGHARTGFAEGGAYDQWSDRNLANAARLLVAIRWGETETFDALLDERTQDWCLDQARSGRMGPVTLLDRVGLGICALARRHGLPLNVESVYLPLDLMGRLNTEGVLEPNAEP